MLVDYDELLATVYWNIYPIVLIKYHVMLIFTPASKVVYQLQMPKQNMAGYYG